MGYLYQDTIVAIATPAGRGGIGIIRLSGVQSIRIAQALFRPKPTAGSEGTPFQFVSHRFYHGYIVDPETNATVDEVLTVVMKAPKSYTREDVVEIQTHGGSVILRKVLDLAIGCGARLADAGEFTKRAFLNGRIDLSQAEAVADCIQAKSDKALRMAAAHLSGGMKTLVEELIGSILEITAILEADIEFPEEIDSEPDAQSLAEQLESGILSVVNDLISRCHEGELLREGVRIVIVGRPNVGKSSLLNQLVQNDKSIVTDIPGTTRDMVEGQFCLDGIPVLVTDTAGLHDSEDRIELIGMRKTRESIAQADIILVVIDGSNPFAPGDFEILEQAARDRTILVINKCDLPTISTDRPPHFADQELAKVEISALTGQNLKGLRDVIVQHCFRGEKLRTGGGHEVLPNLRQKKWLQEAKDFLTDAANGLKRNHSFEWVISDLQNAVKALKAITGENVDSDILGEIFGRFCIGK